MFRRSLLFIFLVILTALALGCQKSGEHLLGAAFEPKAIYTIENSSGTGTSVAPAPVTLQGTMTEKCPVAGCWFYLKDNSGTVKVDVKDAGFVVTEVPTGATVTVSGTIDRTGEEPVFVATGLRW